MQDIIDTELLKVTVNPLKNRLYCAMQGFWQHDEHRTDHLRSVFQQLSQQQGMRTVVLDTTALKIMQPQVAELFIPAFTKFLLDKQITALAHVGNPDNIVLKMQFQRVLRHIEKAREVRQRAFQQHQDAELWLDTL